MAINLVRMFDAFNIMEMLNSKIIRSTARTDTDDIMIVKCIVCQ